MDPFQLPSLSCNVHGLGTKMMLRGIQPYRCGEVGFLVCNFQYMMVEDEEPFVFLGQVQ